MQDPVYELSRTLSFHSVSIGKTAFELVVGSHVRAARTTEQNVAPVRGG